MFMDISQTHTLEYILHDHSKSIVEPFSLNHFHHNLIDSIFLNILIGLYLIEIYRLILNYTYWASIIKCLHFHRRVSIYLIEDQLISFIVLALNSCLISHKNSVTWGIRSTRRTIISRSRLNWYFVNVIVFC